MNRRPPANVLKTLREEVGFGCPIDDCGNPYLEWHHFDPKWSESEHHNPEGMIALCPTHHRKADANTYTKDQLKNYKRNKQSNISGKFDWMRHNLLAIVGGNYYYNTMTIFQYHKQKCIWFNRDENGYFLLNIALIGDNEPVIEDNIWISNENVKDLISPASGKKLNIKYTNKDILEIEFLEINSVKDLKKDLLKLADLQIEYPITIVKVKYKAIKENIFFDPSQTKIKNSLEMTGCFFKNIQVAINIGEKGSGAVNIKTNI